MRFPRRLSAEGQSLVETAIFFFFLAPIIGMMVGFTRYFQIREKLVLASWQGAQLYSSGCVDPREVRQKVQDYLTSGTPALPADRITIQMGRADTQGNWMWKIDRFSVAYSAQRPWHRLLGLPLRLEESCYIKHAPHYWDPVTSELPIPGQPHFSGPQFPW